MPDNELRSSSARSYPIRPGTLIVLIAVLCVALVRLLYMFTYPLNNVGTDTTNYYHMLIEGGTSLTHASGYRSSLVQLRAS
jgi:hypothetical protein